jgi:hypothetical protein
MRIRDLLLLTTLIAIIFGWVTDRTKLTKQLSKEASNFAEDRKELQSNIVRLNERIAYLKKMRGLGSHERYFFEIELDSLISGVSTVRQSGFDPIQECEVVFNSGKSVVIPSTRYDFDRAKSTLKSREANKVPSLSD